MTSTSHTRTPTKAELRHLTDEEATAHIVELRRAIMRLEALRAKFATELLA
jgi:ribosomal protein L29